MRFYCHIDLDGFADALFPEVGVVMRIGPEIAAAAEPVAAAERDELDADRAAERDELDELDAGDPGHEMKVSEIMQAHLAAREAIRAAKATERERAAAEAIAAKVAEMGLREIDQSTWEKLATETALWRFNVGAEDFEPFTPTPPDPAEVERERALARLARADRDLSVGLEDLIDALISGGVLDPADLSVRLRRRVVDRAADRATSAAQR